MLAIMPMIAREASSAHVISSKTSRDLNVRNPSKRNGLLHLIRWRREGPTIGFRYPHHS